MCHDHGTGYQRLWKHTVDKGASEHKGTGYREEEGVTGGYGGLQVLLVSDRACLQGGDLGLSVGPQGAKGSLGIA